MTKEIYLFGRIERWDISAGYISYMLADLKEGDKAIFLIHCKGGDVLEGQAIYNLIKSCKAETEGRILGSCMSMMTTISTAFDKLYISNIATYMIHQTWGDYISGNALELRALADVMTMFDEMTADALSKKTGKTKEDLMSMMQKGDTYIAPKQAVSQKFVDGIWNDDFQDTILDAGKPIPDETYNSLLQSDLKKATQFKQDFHKTTPKTEVQSFNNQLVETKKEVNKMDIEKFKASQKTLAEKYISGVEVDAYMALLDASPEKANEFLQSKIDAKIQQGATTKEGQKEVPQKEFAIADLMKIMGNNGGATAQAFNKPVEQWTYEDYEKHNPKAFADLMLSNPKKAEQIAKQHADSIFVSE